MRNDSDQPGVPGYISIKEAAGMLGLSPSRVYEYVEDGRLSSVRAAHVILIPLEEVKNFKPKLSGRPRRSIPRWRNSPKENMLLSTTIVVQMRTKQLAPLMKRQIEISLIWRRSVAPPEEVRDQALGELRRALADVLDWSTAQYNNGQILMHT